MFEFIRQRRIFSTMVIVETTIFTQRLEELMSDDDYKELQIALVNRPGMGAIIQGTAGLRKIRWKLKDRGKSGGVRIIYYWMTADEQIYMLYIYSKSEQEELTTEQKKFLKKIVERWSDG